MYLPTLFLLALSVATAIAASSEPRFRTVDVDSKIAIGYGITTADVDGDGKPDLVLCDKNQVAWYHNPGWEKHVIAENLTKLDHVCIAAADIDGDGKAEIAVGAGWNPSDTTNSGAVFFLKAPVDRAQRWKPIELPHEPTVHRVRWVKDWQGRLTLVVVPLHGRGNKDASGDGVRIQRYVKPAGVGDWEITTLQNSLHKTHNFDPVQWDDDVAQELLIASKEGVFALNWSQQENRNVLKPIADGRTGGAGEVRLGKLASGGRFVATVEPMHGNALVIYRPPAKGGTNLWDRLVLDETLVEGHALACGDLLGLGRDQIVVGWRGVLNRPGAKVGIRLFIPKDNTAAEWNSVLIDDNTMACEDLCLADLNGDGRLDIIAAGRATHNVKIYMNEKPAP